MGRGGAIPITGVLPFLSFLSLTLSKGLFTNNLLSKTVGPISRFFEIRVFPKMKKYWAVPPTDGEESSVICVKLGYWFGPNVNFI